MTASLVAVLAASCAKHLPKAEPQAPPRFECFDLVVDHNSPSTRAVFEAGQCQGGGVTWAAILDALVRRRGPVTPVHEPVPEVTGTVQTLNGATRFAIDEEGDAARFCTPDRALLAAIRHDYEQLNQDAAALRKVMAEASPQHLECEALATPSPSPSPSARP